MFKIYQLKTTMYNYPVELEEDFWESYISLRTEETDQEVRAK